MLNLRPKGDGDEEKENNSLIRPSFFHSHTISPYHHSYWIFFYSGWDEAFQLTFIHFESKCNIYTSFRMDLLRLLLLLLLLFLLSFPRPFPCFLCCFSKPMTQTAFSISLSLSLCMLPIQHRAYNFYHSPLLFPFCILALASAYFKYVHNRSVLREKY